MKNERIKSLISTLNKAANIADELALYDVSLQIELLTETVEKFDDE